MTTLTDEALIAFNRQGLIPGPGESEHDFLHRAEYCVNLRVQITADLNKELPLSKEDLGDTALVCSAFSKTKFLFDMAPDWIPIFFSNYKLSPWHGGCAWIFQVDEDTPMGAFFQLRQAFRKSKRYLGLYERDELIAHELSHVGRMRFQEPQFEEILSYRTADSRFRRWWGPIIQSSWESMLFVISLILVFVIDISLASFHQHEAYQIAMWAKVFPAGLVAWAVGRLWRRQRHFANCLDKLKEIFVDEGNANAVIYRLQDAEIVAFGSMTLGEIREYAQTHAATTLRWRLILKAYFKTDGVVGHSLN